MESKQEQAKEGGRYERQTDGTLKRIADLAAELPPAGRLLPEAGNPTPDEPKRKRN